MEYAAVNLTTLQEMQDRVLAAKTSMEEWQGAYTECMDTIWNLLAAMLVFFMHAGFSMLEAGCVRFKNTQNILAKNLIVVTVGFLCWYSLGYALAFGQRCEEEVCTEAENKFAGANNFFMDGFWDDKTKFRWWFFQGAFCATAGTIVSGAMAERTQLKGFGVFVVILTAIIYPCIVWWGWSGHGLLWYTNDAQEGVAITGGPSLADFAGSGIVHLTGGVAALVGCIIVGPRWGRWEEGTSEEFTGHSVPLVVLGTFFLWFGWYGFNPGSTGSMHDAGTAFSAGLVAVNTTLAPCVAGLVVFFLRAQVVPPKSLEVGGFCNGILAGLVSITAGCASVKPWEALIIGFIGAFVYQGASMLIQRVGIDDVVDAIPVHGACGIWGLLALGFFGHSDAGGNGLFYGGNQLGTQLFGTLMIVLWVGAVSTAVFFPLRVLGLLRLSEDTQKEGADIKEHSPSKAYADEAMAKPAADSTL